ncbi:MAG: SMC family ATPase, partial [Christensenellaceae bacterium]|nr:SMC family ATPase [Christensenellaceae bacterium]
MRPLQLTMQAFGPYINKTTIDFESLGIGSVYLITGDTGSGKTMIFDAIVFALYGTASGEGRSNDLLRSRSAGPDESTFVELLFEYHGKKYLVRRNPEYMRKSKRGTGETSEKASAELHFLDGRPSISGLVEVNNQLESIIGINKDQFTQIAMIAQGDFLKILRADTKERIETFSRIFNTKNYRILQEKIKSDCSVYDGEVKKLRDKIIQNCESITPAVDDESKLDYWLSLKNVDDISEIIELIDVAIAENKEELKINEEQNLLKDKSLQSLNEEIGRLENLLALKKDLENKKKDYANNLEAYNLLQKSYDAKKLLVPENDKKKLQIEKLQSFYPQYDELEQNNAEHAKNSKNLNDVIKALSIQKSNVEKLENEIKSFNDELLQLKDVDVDLVKIEHSIDQINKTNEEYIDLNKEYQSYRLIKIELAKAQADAEKAILASNVKSEEYNKKNTEFLKNQAGILAKNLKPGKSCPVCGSINHPKPATLTDSTISKEALEKLKNQSNEFEKKA